MFNANESFSIENAKAEIQSLIKSRNLLSGLYGHNVVIAGGFFTNVLQNNKFKDIDIFVLNNDYVVYNHLTEGFKKQSERQEKERERVLRGDLLSVTPINSIFQDVPLADTEWSRSEMMAYMHNKEIVDVINNHKTDAQYILTKYQTREELLAHFDYKHCKVSYVPVEEKLYINRETYDCIQNKILKINNDQKSKNHQYRLSNFLAKGWTLDDGSKKTLLDAQREVIRESFEKLKQEAIGKVMIAGTEYTINKQTLDDAGITAQTVEDTMKRYRTDSSYI
jgi:hypothetical protein